MKTSGKFSMGKRSLTKSKSGYRCHRETGFPSTRSNTQLVLITTTTNNFNYRSVPPLINKAPIEMYGASVRFSFHI